MAVSVPEGSIPSIPTISGWRNWQTPAVEGRSFTGSKPVPDTTLGLPMVRWRASKTRVYGSNPYPSAMRD